MARHLNYNPGRDSVEYLEAITCGENRHYILDQLLISLRAEIGRPNHQHHLLIGPRGSGKTHLLRLLTAGRIPKEPALAIAYLPVVMPEETPLRSPGDLFLKFVERLADLLKEPPAGITPDAARVARGVCMTALTTAKGIRDPLERLEVMAAALESAATTLGRIILPIAENMDQTFYLGAQRSRKGPLDEQWALRRHLQQTAHILLIAAAPSIFGAVGDPGKPFYDFFRTHELQELSNDEVLEIIHRRLQEEATNPGLDGMRIERVRCILAHFDEKAPQLRGILAITGGLPRFTHLTYEVIVETDVNKILDTLNAFLDDLTPYFQHRLDPRVIPQPEIDLLHTLALARGPLQPSELAYELYGVSTNEISELLGRLQERGLVKRAGRPGGQAVTWDLTEPLYRVWTQFRDNPDGQDMFRLLGKLVALLFNPEEIEKERKQLEERLFILSDGHSEVKAFRARLRLLENAYVFFETSAKAEKTSVEESACVPIGTGEADDREQSEALLAELRMLYQAHPDDAPVREELARGLFNAHFDAGEAGDQEQSEALLAELRMLYQEHPDDAPVRARLARGLFNAHFDARKAGNREQSEALLAELRMLYHERPDDATVRDQLAGGLFNAHVDARKAGDRDQSEALLAELRMLYEEHPDDAPVREELAKGLVNAHVDAGEAGDREQGQALLEELRMLNRAYPDDAAVRERVAKGLANAHLDAVKAGNREQSEALLAELRMLYQEHPDDACVREQLAKGLANAHFDAVKAGNRKQSEALLAELRMLYQEHPDDAPVREELARGLFNAHFDAGEAGDQEQSEVLLAELRMLYQEHPDDAPVRARLARGLFNAHFDARKAGNREQSVAFLAELRMLYQDRPDDASVREQLAGGLFNAHVDAQKAGDRKQSRLFLEELLNVFSQYSDETIEEAAQRAVKSYVTFLLTLMKAGDTATANEGMRWLEPRMPSSLAEFLRPMALAMDVLEKGEEQALAREPEEVRRVVRMVLEKLDQ